MKFGLFSMGEGSCIEPEAAGQIARLAEQLGFESLWAGEHVVLPDPQVPPSPLAPTDPILDPLITLSFLAAHTAKIKLGTGIIILPQRNPLVLAKQLASLDQLAGGRLIFGLGVGYLRPEMEAVGVPYHERGARTEEYLAAMQNLWTAEKPSFAGQFVNFAGIQAYPKRAINVVMGGESRPALQRAIRSANGWYGFGYNPENAAKIVAEIGQLAQTVERPAELGELDISFTPPPRQTVTPEMVEQYSELGVARLIIAPPRHLQLEQLEQFVRQTASDLLTS